MILGLRKITIIFFRKTITKWEVFLTRTVYSLSLLRKEGPLPAADIVREYVKLAVDYDNYYINSNIL